MVNQGFRARLGAQIDKTQLLLGAGIEANPDDNTAIGVGIDTDIGKYQTEARVQMRVRVRF